MQICDAHSVTHFLSVNCTPLWLEATQHVQIRPILESRHVEGFGSAVQHCGIQCTSIHRVRPVWLRSAADSACVVLVQNSHVPVREDRPPRRCTSAYCTRLHAQHGMCGASLYAARCVAQALHCILHMMTSDGGLQVAQFPQHQQQCCALSSSLRWLATSSRLPLQSLKWQAAAWAASPSSTRRARQRS